MKIKICTLSEIKQVTDLVFTINQDIRFRCRPFMLNENYTNIKEAYINMINKESQGVLLLYNDNELLGVTGIYWVEKDYYVSITRGIFAKDNYEVVAQQFLDYIAQQYKGYKLYINTPKEHLSSIEFCATQLFKKVDHSVLYVLKEYANSFVHEKIQFLNEFNQETLFWHLNQIITEDTYWNIERLKDSLDTFIILGHIDSTIQGTLYAQIYKDSSVEVMGIHSKNLSITKRLLQALAHKCNELSSQSLWIYTDNEDEIQIAMSLHYLYYDSNICFIKAL